MYTFKITEYGKYLLYFQDQCVWEGYLSEAEDYRTLFYELRVPMEVKEVTDEWSD